MNRNLLSALIACGINALTASPVTISTNLKIDQFGYRPTDGKVCIIAQPQSGAGSPSGFSPSATLKIRRWSDDVEVFSGAPTAWNSGATHSQSGDKVWWFNFSSLTTAGDYYVFDPTNNVGSYKFRIADDVYLDVLKAATKALFYQRCGTAISAANGGTWNHTACHVGANQDLACRLVTDQSNAATAKDLSGGWHDAGDYNKYVNFTYNTLHNLLFAYQENPSVFTDDLNIPESGNGVADLLDEIKWELDWLLKMQQTDGSVLSKLGVVDFYSASPPSADAATHYYGAASTSSTLTVASIFAHAYLVFKDIPTYAAYATTLKTKAELAWTWAAANPSVTYANTGFSSATPEVSSYDIDARKTCAAALLFAATGTASYKTYFEANYTAIHPYAWTYFYAFEQTYGDILLFYTALSGATASVKTNILTAFNGSTNGQVDFFLSYTNKTDAYRAYLKDGDYVWGSNLVKSQSGLMYENMIKYNQTPANKNSYRTYALDYLHFLHGTNPLSKLMLSNVNNLGADNSVAKFYHSWTGNGSALENNPIPGLVMGGFNNSYDGTNGYFSGQPVQKKYLDFNDGYPQNSWEITEPGIYYQAGYIRLVSKYANGTNNVLPLSVVEFWTKLADNQHVILNFETLDERDVTAIDIERAGEDGVGFEKITTIKPKNAAHNIYQFIDDLNAVHPSPTAVYYRLKIQNLDGKFQLSKVESVNFLKQKMAIRLFPNPAADDLNIETEGFSDGNISIEMLNVNGQIVASEQQQVIDNQRFLHIDISQLANGFYTVRLTEKATVRVEKFSVSR